MAQVIGLRAPGHVYSAVLKNDGDHDVTVDVEYGATSGSNKYDVEHVTVSKGGSTEVKEKTVTAEGGHEERKFISKITVKLHDGTTQQLTAPFDGVTSPKQGWEFHIGKDGSLKSGSA